MPTPMAHMMVGAATGMIFSPKARVCTVLKWGTLGASVSLLPDLDIIITLLGTQWEAAHRTITHSLPVVTLVAALLWVTRGRRTGVMVLSVLVSHLLMDLFCQDVVPPLGLRLFWPLFDAFIHSDIYVFLSVFTPDKSLLPLPQFLFSVVWEFLVAFVISLLLVLFFGRKNLQALLNGGFWSRIFRTDTLSTPKNRDRK